MKIYLVGGAVRDRLLGRKPRERDWVVVGGSEEEMLARGLTRVGHAFPVFIDPATGEEYALARSESKVSAGHKGFAFDTSKSVDLETDLRRRDLTINAMAEEDGKIIDPFGGQRDLENRVLRHVSEAFVEDPLRVMRVARFGAELRDFGFEVCPETLDLMRGIATSGELEHLTRERVWGELAKVADTRWLDVFLHVLDSAGCLSPWFSECRLDDSERLLLGTWQRQLPSPVSRIAALGGLLGSQASQQLMQRIGAPKRFARAISIISRHTPAMRAWQAGELRAINFAFHALSRIKPEQAQKEVLNTLALTTGISQALLAERLGQYAALKLDDNDETPESGTSYGRMLNAKRLSLIGSWMEAP